MRQIIILETNPSNGGMIQINAVFWFPVPVGHEVPVPSFTSAFKTPTTQEATDLQEGKVVEESLTLRYPKSFTPAQIKGALSATWSDRKAYRDSLPDKGQYYGTSWDGISWT